MEMKERDTAMNRFTFLCSSLLLGAMSLAAVAMFLFCQPDDSAHAFGALAALCALICGGVLLTVLSTKIKELEQPGACDVAEAVRDGDEAFGKMLQERARVANALDQLATEISSVANKIYTYRSPTDADMRAIRRELIMYVINALYAGVEVTTVTRCLRSPDVIRDVVQTMLKDGRFDLTNGPEWQGELAKYVFTGKPTVDAPPDAAA